ncbi:hypothetical protein [Streptomyces yaizuensis]|uniref:Atg14 domain-containing protein n=1 Tax=Streptomyces yaizuensis TaxID=2989713 RepID=A0ABQ5NXX3_9ACTN|nr:hypothetical protein [Streptomyces sp. YSPA8]GLF95222.1 Atg14 domain-containing protein [Streptomyces sp. YSPA8]
MPRITEEDKTRNEAAIRAAIERVLAGNLPPGHRTDLKTLATLAGVTRTSFYPKKNHDGTTRPGTYQHLAEEFDQRVRELQATGAMVDPRAARIERLKTENAALKTRIAAREEKLAELTEFKTLAICRLAAQHDEIERLRRQGGDGGNVRRLPVPTVPTAPHGSSG